MSSEVTRPHSLKKKRSRIINKRIVIFFCSKGGGGGGGGVGKSCGLDRTVVLQRWQWWRHAT